MSIDIGQQNGLCFVKDSDKRNHYGISRTEKGFFLIWVIRESIKNQVTKNIV